MGAKGGLLLLECNGHYKNRKACTTLLYYTLVLEGKSSMLCLRHRILFPQDIFMPYILHSMSDANLLLTFRIATFSMAAPSPRFEAVACASLALHGKRTFRKPEMS